MMQYVKVTFPESRSVFVDGEETGLTNKTLRVEQGTHTFKLGDPQDYTPKWRRCRVTGTSVIKPMEVPFDKV